jgi:crotonobetainyl-CoA:carnitine CoA-transferase CaiB-like acyl-CoA transferase
VSESEGPLAGLKVLDLGAGPATGLATMMLADFGARVLRYPDPEGSHLDRISSARMWLRGKAEGTELHGDLSTADVIVVSEPNGHPGIDYESVRRRNPSVVYARLTAAGERSTLPPYEPVLAAWTGRMQNLTGIAPEGGPHFAAVPVATHATAQNLLSGILAAVLQRRRTGAGQQLATSLLQGFMPYDQGQSLFLQVRPDRSQPDPATIMPTLNYHPVQCADGKWLQLGNLLPHLFASFMRVIGLEDLLEGLPETTEAVRDRILETMQTRTRDVWMDLFVRDGGIAAHPYLTAPETLADPDMTANGHVLTLNGVTQLGPVARLTRTPARITAEAKPAVDAPWCSAATTTDPDALPLAGVTVLELATIIASPLGASFLADLGARVIKVEAIGGDPYRHMAGGIGATRCNQGKESISIDLKHPTGQRIVRSLAEKADVLIHNYRPGVPERLGIGYESLATLNPELVYVSANGYGPDGPGALRPSTHPIPGAAMGGAGYQAGGPPETLLDLPDLREAARRLMRANEVNPDPNTAMVVCSASLLGLAARAATGEGQQIFVDMFGANAYANFDDLIDYPGKPERPPLGPGLRGPNALNRLYPAAEGWVFLGVYRQEEWERFCRVGGFESDENPFPAGAPAADVAVSGNDSPLAEALGRYFAGRSADEWEALFEGSGVGCVRADRLNTGEFFAGPGGGEWMVPVSHAELGTYLRHGPMVSFAAPQKDLHAGVRAGVDGRSLLAELGYPAEEADRLFDEGVLFSVDEKRA